MEEVIFQQNGFISSQFSAIEDMRIKGELVDFTFTFGSRVFTGHRLVLAAAIPKFRTLFIGPEQAIILEEIHLDVLDSVIDFAYTGKIKITPQNVQPLLLASKYLQLTGVYEACWNFLIEKLDCHNVLEIRQFAEDHQCLRFKNIAEEYIVQNFEEFCLSRSFLVVPFGFLKELLKRGDINVSNEEKLIDAVLKWAKASPFERRDLLPDLLSVVRMHNVSPDYFNWLISSHELLVPCRKMLNELETSVSISERSKLGHLVSQQLHHTNITPEDDSDFGNNIFAVISSEYGFSVKLFEKENQKWSSLSNHEAMAMEKVEAVGETICIFGTEKIVTFNVNARKWNSLRIFCHGICFSGTAVHNSRVYFFGGFAGTDSEMVRYFDPEQMVFVIDFKMNNSLRNPAAATLGEFIYVTGGEFGSTVYNVVQLFNPKTKQWTEASPMLCRRYEHSCIGLKGRIYVCGGICDKILDSAEVYDPSTGQWHFIAPMIKPKSGFSLTSVDEKLYVCKNWSGQFEGVINMEIYDPTTTEWKLGAPLSICSDCEVFLVTPRQRSADDEKKCLVM